MTARCFVEGACWRADCPTTLKLAREKLADTLAKGVAFG